MSRRCGEKGLFHYYFWDGGTRAGEGGGSSALARGNDFWPLCPQARDVGSACACGNDLKGQGVRAGGELFHARGNDFFGGAVGINFGSSAGGGGNHCCFTWCRCSFSWLCPCMREPLHSKRYRVSPEKALPMRAELIGRHKLCAGTGHLRDARRNHGLFFLSGIC